MAVAIGLAPGRIIFSNTAGKEEHVRRSQLADVFLDTWLCNGHTTSLDVLWTGMPVVTLPGETFASRYVFLSRQVNEFNEFNITVFDSRVTASILATIDCHELIADSLQSYEQIAIRLGNDRRYLLSTRDKVLKARFESPLFDVQNYAIGLEKLYGKMWDRHARGQGPDHISSF